MIGRLNDKANSPNKGKEALEEVILPALGIKVTKNKEVEVNNKESAVYNKEAKMEEISMNNGLESQTNG